MSTAKPAPATAGRPREFDVDEALDRALDVFWRHGLRSTTTRRLEAALGVTQSSLYAAFGSKRELFEAALDRYEAGITAALLEPLEQAPGGVAAIDRFIGALGAWITADGKRGCMLANLMAEQGGEDGPCAARAARYRHRVRKALRDALAREPGVDGTTAEEGAAILIAAVLGLNLAARAGASRAEITGLLDAIRHLLARWAAPGPDSPGRHGPPPASQP